VGFFYLAAAGKPTILSVRESLTGLTG